MDDLSPNRPNVLGVKPQGVLDQSTYSIDLFGTDVSDAGTLAVTDRLAKLMPNTAQTLSEVKVVKGKTTYIYSVGAVNTYGLGQAVTLGFDPTKTDDETAVKDILRRAALRQPAQPAADLPFSVVPVKIDLGSKVPLKVRVKPQTPGVEAMSLNGDSGSFTELDLVPDATSSVSFALRLPKEMGVTTVTVAVEYFSPEDNEFKPYSVETIELGVDKDIQGLKTEARDLLDALDVKKSDRAKVENIKALVVQAVGAEVTDDTSEDSPILLMIKAIETLSRIDASTSQARLALDRILDITQVDWTVYEEANS
jgi:hypothetical protein